MARGTTINYSDRIVAEECCSCGIWFGVPVDFQKERIRDHAWFHCPNGHAQQYRRNEVERDRERQRLRAEAAEARATHLSDQLRSTERSNAALRGVVTRTKRRIGKGICPCCNRHFANVERHMEAKHPDYADESST